MSARQETAERLFIASGKWFLTVLCMLCFRGMRQGVAESILLYCISRGYDFMVCVEQSKALLAPSLNVYY